MEQVELRAQSRQVLGKKVKQLRANLLIPAVVYGPDTPPLPIQSDERDMLSVLRVAGATQLINLFVDDEKAATPVLARDISSDALTGQLLHVDFYQVRLTEKVKTTPHLEVIGESPVIKAGTAVLIHNMTEIEVECLPTHLVRTIAVDISGLETLDDTVTVSELEIPDGVTVLADPDDVVVSVITTRAAVVEEDLLLAEELEEGEEEAEEEEEVQEED